jgi:peptidoglycan/LPS O-acetylase OafA/YrhL
MFFRIAMRDPIFGAGPSAATEAADGYYVRSFTEVGLVGTAAFVAFIGSIMFGFWRVFRRTQQLARSMALGMIAATVFVALVGILIDTWVASRVMQLYWPLAGALLASVGALSIEGRRPTEP